MGEVVGRVDVEGEARIAADLDAQPEPSILGDRQCLVEVGLERPGAVADGERRLDRQDEHVRAAAGAIGDEADRPGRGQRRPGRCASGRSLWAITQVVEALAGDRRPARLDGTVETEPRRPQHVGADRVGP